MNRLMDWWQELSSSQRTSYKRIILAVLFLLIATLGYQVSRGPSSQSTASTGTPVEQEVAVGADGLEQDIRASVDQQVNKALEEQQKTIQALQEQLKTIQASRAEVQKKQQSDNDLANFLPKNIDSYPNDATTPAIHGYPPAPSMDNSHPTAQAIAVEGEKMPEQQVIGGISFTPGAPLAKEEGASKKNKIFLPPSFMPAKLITGIDARTTQDADANPEPIMLRVQAPAVLPNHLKANLRGCFVMADAVGDLSKERVKVRLQSLSCLNKDGNAVINQPIKGFVTDEDGKRDMAGIVISRAGSNLARTFAAGFLGGFGEAVQSANTLTNLNPLGGATQTIKSGGVMKAAAGSGIKTASDDLRKFYLELAKQAMPVIEVGAAKNVTAVIQQGVELEIKEF